MKKFSYKYLLIILLSMISIRAQPEVISTSEPQCYIVDRIRIATLVNDVEGSLGIIIKIKKDFDIITIDDKTLYFYREILWRIEVKNRKLDCQFDKYGVYWDDCIRVIKSNNVISITDTYIWGLIVKDIKVKKQKTWATGSKNRQYRR